VLVFGSVNLDTVFTIDEFPQPGETRAGAEVSVSLGGKGANQAVAAARLGANVVFVGCVGDDPEADLALRQLRSEGVDVEKCRRVSGVSTGRAGILVNRHGENLIVVADGANAALGPDDARSSADRIASAGAVVAQLETPIAGVSEAFREARESGARTILNAAPASDLPTEVTGLVDVLVVNQSEAATMACSDGADATEDARTLAQRLGIEMIIVTMGERGALLWRRGAAREIPAPSVDAVDSTGAGDAFVGALSHGLAGDEAPELAARRGCVAGGLAATRRGAMRAMPRRDEVEAELGRS
jgi:ribokinase